MRTLKLFGFLVIVVTVTSQTAIAQTMVAYKPIKIGVAPPDYRLLTFSSRGGPDTSILDDSPDGIRGRYYRLTFLANDDLDIRPVMRIDELIYFDAGWGLKVRSSWEVDLNKVEKLGVPMPNVVMSEITEIRWKSIQSATFRYGISECSINKIGSELVNFGCN